MYLNLYEILQNGIYGADTVLTGDMELTLTILATAGCVFLVSLPFLLVWKIIKML